MAIPKATPYYVYIYLFSRSNHSQGGMLSSLTALPYILIFGKQQVFAKWVTILCIVPSPIAHRIPLKIGIWLLSGSTVQILQ